MGPPAGRSRRFGPGRPAAFDPNPPMIDVAPTTRRRLRWVGTVTSTATLIVTRACLLSCIVASGGIVATATVNNYTPIYESVRVKRMRITLPPYSLAAGVEPTQQLSVEWTSFLGRDTKISKNVTSSTGASFVSVPPPGSRAAMWSSSNTAAAAASTINEVLFVVRHDPDFNTPTLTMPIVIDLDLEFVQANDTAAVLAVTAGGQWVAGQNAGLFQMPLDCITPGAIVGAMRLSPSGLPDIRLDAANAATAITALTRTN